MQILRAFLKSAGTIRPPRYNHCDISDGPVYSAVAPNSFNLAHYSKFRNQLPQEIRNCHEPFAILQLSLISPICCDLPLKRSALLAVGANFLASGIKAEDNRRN
jgi:hypothetical protein